MRGRPIAYVADGERDHRMLPPLVATVVGAHREGGFTAWKDVQLQGGAFGTSRTSGYGRKLRLVLMRAEGNGCDLVAMVDRDRSGGRLEELSAARDAAGGRVACAVGEAVPHGEAWLVDDLEPLRRVLGLDAQAPRPDLRDPKSAFDGLVTEAGVDRLDAFAAVAAAVEPGRCLRARETGFADFVADLREQFVVA